MILVAVVASEELLHPRGSRSEARNSDHRAVVKLIHSHGVLTFRDRDDRTAFASLVADLPPGPKGYWEHLLKYGRQMFLTPPPPMALPTVKTREQLTAWAEWADLACMPADVVDSWPGVDVDESSFIVKANDRSLEVVKDGPTSSRRFEQALDNVVRPVAANTGRDKVKQQILVPLLQYARRVVIHDRYLGVGLLRAEDATIAGPDAAAEVEQNKGELEWMLDVVNEFATPKRLRDGALEGARVTLLTTYEDDFEREGARMAEALEKVTARVWRKPWRGLESVALNLLPRYGQDSFGTAYMSAHDRCLQITHARSDRQHEDSDSGTTSFLLFSAGLTSLRPIRMAQDSYSVNFKAAPFKGEFSGQEILLDRVGQDYNRSQTVAGWSREDVEKSTETITTDPEG